jgi:uncharacterized protein with von Willebrand factor type A (vWA) domain
MLFSVKKKMVMKITKTRDAAHKMTLLSKKQRGLPPEQYSTARTPLSVTILFYAKTLQK